MSDKKCPLKVAGWYACSNSTFTSVVVECDEDRCQWWWKCKEPEAPPPSHECDTCKYEDLDFNAKPCDSCVFDKWEPKP